MYFQPSFGSEIRTPPENHQPPFLLQDVSPGLDDVVEEEPPADDIRGSGVGSDSDIEGTDILYYIAYGAESKYSCSFPDIYTYPVVE